MSNPLFRARQALKVGITLCFCNVVVQVPGVYHHGKRNLACHRGAGNSQDGTAKGLRYCLHCSGKIPEKEEGKQQRRWHHPHTRWMHQVQGLIRTKGLGCHELSNNWAAGLSRVFGWGVSSPNTHCRVGILPCWGVSHTGFRKPVHLHHRWRMSNCCFRKGGFNCFRQSWIKVLPSSSSSGDSVM